MTVLRAQVVDEDDPAGTYAYALRAFEIIRAALTEFGSDNIREKASLMVHKRGVEEYAPKATREELEAYTRKKMRELKMSHLKPTQPKFGDTYLGAIIEYGRMVMDAHAGNCFEYSAAACTALSEMQPPPTTYDVVRMPELDHAFVVIGQPLPANGIYPMDFSAWEEHAAICDGWADIVCWAREYPSMWDLTMRLWNLQDKEVPIGNQAWGSPRTYLGAPAQEVKQSYTWKKDNCYLTTATCLSLELPDDCHELTTMRRYRDEVLLRSADGARGVQAYYEVAPRIVESINARDEAAAIYQDIYERYIVPGLRAVSQGEHEEAGATFERLVSEMSARFLG